MRYEPVQAIINERGDIYYVTNYDGQCAIWEINTFMADNMPHKIYEQRTSRCFGFNID